MLRMREILEQFLLALLCVLIALGVVVVAVYLATG
jgi:hypothetical protein